MIVMRDLFELLEKVIDRCRDAGNIVFRIVLEELLRRGNAAAMTLGALRDPVRAGLRVHQRFSRHGQRDCHGGFHPRARPAAGGSPGGGAATCSARCWARRWPRPSATGMVDSQAVTLHALLSAMLAAIAWNLFTWWLGLPSSSSHALIGGLCGAAVAAARGNFSVIRWSVAPRPTAGKGCCPRSMLPMVTSPVLGLVVRLPGDGRCCWAAAQLAAAPRQYAVRPAAIGQRLVHGRSATAPTTPKRRWASSP